MVNTKTYSYSIGLIFLLLMFFGCGGDGSHSTDSNAGAGSIGFGLAWESPDGASMSKSTVYRAASTDVCTDYGITTINAYVINSSNSTVTSGSWACSEHGGSHTAVPAGSNYTLRVEAVVSGAVKWRGEVTGISIITGQTTNLGQITMSYIGNDTTPPTVLSTSPASNATSVPVNSIVTASFSEKIAPSSLGTTTFTLSNGPIQINGTVSYDQTTMTATFTPISPLSYSTTYTASLTTGVKDMANNNLQSAYTWTFTTGSTPDTTPPTVSSTSPANSADNVAVNTAITATFSETMDASTLSTATFTLNNGLTGTVTYSGATATFTPSSNLAYSTTYTATISPGAKDGVGNAMAAAYTWTFITGAAVDTTLPQVAITSPGASGTTVDVSSSSLAISGTASDNAFVTQVIWTNDTGGKGIASGTTAWSVSGITLQSGWNTITVKAYDAAGNWNLANLIVNYTPSAPSTPTGVTATAGNGHATISWNSVPGATSYNIYWSMTSGVTKTSGSKQVNMVSPQLMKATNGYAYYYVVTAVNSYGESSESSQVSVTPQSSGIPIAIAAGANHSLALKDDGTVWAWGDNRYGALGNGTTVYSSTPVQVNGLTGAAAIAGGEFHSLALKGNGTVWAWGKNSSGLLGNGTTISSSIPVQVSGLTGITAIAGGLQHSLALKGDGTVWAWGWNGNGQLGDGKPIAYSTNYSTIPIQVVGLTNVIAIAGGETISLAIKSNGTVWAWGHSPLGNGGADSSTAVQVSGLTGIAAISAGGDSTMADHSIALKDTGTVWAWGANGDGQLGIGAVTYPSVIPIQVSGLTGATAIAAGHRHSLALKGDGTVLAWGNNSSGRLGNGTTTDSYSPVMVSGLTGVTAIAGGEFHSLALMGNGTVWAWGSNWTGQLGNGTITGKYYPVQVVGF